jgi:hypothetical protein
MNILLYINRLYMGKQEIGDRQREKDLSAHGAGWQGRIGTEKKLWGL